MERLKTEIACMHCNCDLFVVSNTGPHRKLVCANCGKYVKFIPKDQEDALWEEGRLSEDIKTED
jgi:transcription elongation factor Elf1